MIARYCFLLPYTFSIKNGSSFSFQEFKRERYTIRLLPPQQCKVNITEFDVAKGASVDELADQITPVQLQPGTSGRAAQHRRKSDSRGVLRARVSPK